VLQLPEVLEALAVGHRAGGDEEVVLFVVPAEQAGLTAALEERIRAAVRAAASPRHVPARILAVPEIPRTLSGKPVELAVRAVLHGEAVENLDALANPAALEHFRNRI
jgi:acetoacetyl-CoA synthetase